jgi:hypothetical protein
VIIGSTDMTDHPHTGMPQRRGQQPPRASSIREKSELHDTPCWENQRSQAK